MLGVLQNKKEKVSEYKAIAAAAVAAAADAVADATAAAAADFPPSQT